MIDTEKIPTGGDAASANISEKKRENEKKKRSRVKQLLADVKKQVEFWFSDVNIHKDRFMKSLIEQSRDGYIDISVFTSFNRMKKLTTDIKLIARALKNSSLVEVNLEGTRIRRKCPLGESPKDVDSRTVYVELLPKTVNHLWVERVFSKCGNVVYVSIPRYKSTGHPKGFAFVEFETEEQAQKAIEVLNNPPEDAPRKPGIFPKTCKKKNIPFDAVQDTQEEEEDGKKKKKKRSRSGHKSSAAEEMVVDEVKDTEGTTEAEVTTETKKKLADEFTTENPVIPASTAGKKAEKKRRRSRSAEASNAEGQDGMPAKMRKVEKEENKESDMKDLSSEERNEELLVSEKKDDSILKAKRKRKKKHKDRLKIGEELLIPLRVLSKKEWLTLKQEYLTLQKRCMATLKHSVTQINQKPIGCDIMQTKEHDKEDSCKDTAKKDNPSGPEFVSGVIVKISYNQPLPSKKCIKDTLSEVSAVAYVDILDGDAEGHIRCKSPEDAQAIITARPELQKKHNWNLELLSGDHEQRYWQKILVDRQAKLNRPREKKRGTEKLLSKAEKIIIARAKEASKHIRFDD